MDFEQQIYLSLIRGGVSLGLLLITWVIGKKILNDWDLKKKKQELDLNLMNDFQELYGEFKDIARIWKVLRSEKYPEFKLNDENRFQLLERASRAESKVEALILKLVTERRLNDKELETIGFFRQACQLLRQNIRKNELFYWDYGDEVYHLFNKSSCEILSKISSLPSVKNSSEMLKKITDFRSKQFKRYIEQREQQD